MDGSLLVAVVLGHESLHIFEGDLPFIITVENALVGGDVGRSGVELLVHSTVEVHQHLACCDRLQHAVFVVIIHLEDLPEEKRLYLVSSVHRCLLKSPPFYMRTTWSW